MQKFLEYWAAARQEQPDDAKQLYNAYQSALAGLADSRLKTHRLLVPHNNGKAWHPAFDPDMVEEVVALNSEIDAKKATLKAISDDINTFVAAVGGPTISPLIEQSKQAQRRITDAMLKAKNATMIENNKNPRLVPLEVQELPEVVAANLALAEVRNQHEPVIADLKSRLEKARKIMAKY